MSFSNCLASRDATWRGSEAESEKEAETRYNHGSINDRDYYCKTRLCKAAGAMDSQYSLSSNISANSFSKQRSNESVNLNFPQGRSEHEQDNL